MGATAAATCDAASDGVLSQLTESPSDVAVWGMMSDVFPFDAMILMGLLSGLCNDLRVSDSQTLLVTQWTMEDELTLI